MSRRRNRRNQQPIRGLPRNLLTLLGVLSLLVVGTVLVLSMRPRQDVAAPTADVLSPEAVESPTPAVKVGYVGGCVRQPEFVRDLGFGDQPLIGTSFRGVTGFAVANQSTGQLYQDPSSATSTSARLRLPRWNSTRQTNRTSSTASTAKTRK